MARNTSPKDQCTLDGAVLAALKDCSKGEYIRLTVNGSVYIRAEYDRSTKRYALQRFDDVNKVRYLAGSRLVFVGFTF
jgi:hypothetical protein